MRRFGRNSLDIRSRPAPERPSRNRRIGCCVLAAIGIVLLVYVFTPRTQIPYDRELWRWDPYGRYRMRDDLHRILRERTDWTPASVGALLPGLHPWDFRERPGGGFGVSTKLGTRYVGKFIVVGQRILVLTFDSTGRLIEFLD